MGGLWTNVRAAEEWQRSAGEESFTSASLEVLERFVRRNDLHRRVRPVPRSLRGGFCARLGAAVPGVESGAAGRAVLRVEGVSGAGGAHYPG